MGNRGFSGFNLEVANSVLVWFITGAWEQLHMRNFGNVPLQRHPMVAVTLVCVSVQRVVGLFS